MKGHVHSIFYRERYYDNKLNSVSIFTGDYDPNIHDLLKDTPRYVDDVINFKQIMARSLKGVLHAKSKYFMFLCFSHIKDQYVR